jgi:micrococcal nuclease
MFQYRAVVSRVVDGDTVDFLVDLGFHVSMLVRCRVARIDTPEMSEEAGKLAKAEVQRLLPVGADCRLDTAKGDRYGRWIGEVTMADGRNLSDVLLSTGFAKAYQ